MSVQPTPPAVRSSRLVATIVTVPLVGLVLAATACGGSPAGTSGALPGKPAAPAPASAAAPSTASSADPADQLNCRSTYESILDNQSIRAQVPTFDITSAGTCEFRGALVTIIVTSDSSHLDAFIDLGRQQQRQQQSATYYVRGPNWLINDHDGSVMRSVGQALGAPVETLS